MTRHPAESAGQGARRGALAGFWAGLFLGCVEAAERCVALAAHLAGPGDVAGLALLTVAPVVLVSTILGWLAATAAGLARILASPSLVPWHAARRALGGAVVGLVAGLWFLFALTLTARLSSWLERAPLWLLVSTAGGAVLALALSRWPAPPRAVTALGLGAGVLALHFVNSRFAPQSSYGVHVLLDTAEVGAAWLGALLFVRGASWRAILALLAALLSLGVTMDRGWRSAPATEALVKTRGVLSRRAMDAISWSLDWDGDGFAPALLAGGFDDEPFDPALPPPLLRCGEAPAESAAPRPGESDSRAPGASDRPHILLLTVDALRYDVIPQGEAPHPLGDAAPSLPQLAGLAVRAARFETCYAHASGTEDSFGSLFAGRHHPGLLCGVPWEEHLPARLAASGYRTHAWVNRPPMPRRAWGWEHIEVRDGETEEQIEALLDFLAGDTGAASGPAFAWMHLMNLHGSTLKPWSPQAYQDGAQRERYRKGLAAVDRVIGELLAGLEARGLARRTRLVLTADHGEELGEHGHFHHNLSLYEPAVRVPLWMAGPGIEPGRRAEAVTHLDLHATLLAWAGVAPGPPGGRRIAEDLEAPSGTASGIYLFLPARGFSRRASPVRLEHGQAAWVDAAARRKVILRFDKETEEFYDLAADPRESRNLAGGDAPWIAALRQEAWDAVRRNGAP